MAGARDLAELARRTGAICWVTLEDRQPTVGQSVRGGTQNRGRLLDRRDDRIAALREALQAAVDEYQRRLPGADPGHPPWLTKQRDLRAVVNRSRACELVRPRTALNSAAKEQAGMTMNQSEMTAKIERGDGFIAALDQSGGSTPKALKGYGIEDGAWGNDEEMFNLIHQMRSRIITSPCFGGGKVIGAILFERTMDGQVAGKPTPQALIDQGVVPFIKIDKGLEAEDNGVQLMKPIPDLDALLQRAKSLGVFGTKERSVINAADPAGIAVVVAQQFEIARHVLDAGMVPIIEPEVNIRSADRPESDDLLLTAILEELEEISDEEKVMLKLSIPAKPGLFQPLIDHPKVLRVVALSGGFSREEACRELAKNPGMIASFSRALLSDLRAQQSDDEFDRTLGSAIDEIYSASTSKVLA